MKKYMVVFLIMAGIFLQCPVYAETLNFNEADFFDKHSSVMLIIDAETGEIQGANDAALSFYGYTESELLALNINEINTLPQEEIMAEMKLATKQERNYFTFEHRKKDGSTNEVEVYTTPATDSNGRDVLLSIVHDISPRLIAEQNASGSKIIIIVVLASGLILLGIMLIYMRKSRQHTLFMKERFERLFNNMNEGFALHEIICDAEDNPIDYRFLEVNRAFELMTGLKGDLVRNRKISEILPETEKYWIEKYGRVALTGETIHFSNYSKEIGKHFNVSVYSPKSRQFATIFTDVTDQITMSEKIKFERNLLETILEDTLSGYWNWDFESGEEYMSPSFKKMIGYRVDELENLPGAWQKVILAEDLPKVQENLEKHIASRGDIPFYNEVRYLHKDGTIVWVIFSGRVAEWDSSGRPRRMVGCHINITDLKHLEKNLMEERTLLHTTLQSLGDGVISTDKEGNVDLMNPVAEALTGWKSSEAKGKKFEEIFYIMNELTREVCENPVKAVFETGEPSDLKAGTVLIRKNGEEIAIEDSVAPIKDETGGTAGAVVVFRDFSEKKEKQEKIIYLSYHDQLTGLYNRLFFEEELARLDVERNLPITIAMLDVNGLKLTNDAFGHQKGDKLLQIVGRILKKECRADDIVARVGGDEFVILLPKTEGKETEAIVHRIYDAVARENLENVVISVSIGWDTKFAEEQSMEDVFAKAEELMYRKKLTESQSMRNQTIQIILKTMNEKNDSEKHHSEMVGRISRRIGEALDLDHEMLNAVETAGLMHDIGKVAIKDSLLNKPGSLSESEYDEVKRHSEVGYHILKSVDSYTQLADYVLHHHERWDGMGYPGGLSAEEIPLISRIISLAEAYVTMVAEQPYKSGMDKADAAAELEKQSGTQFDAAIVKAFLEKCLDEL